MIGRRNLSDYQRGVLALRMKPIMEKRARANMAARKGEQAGATSQISDELIKPIRSDEAVSELANVSRDTIRKIERIEAKKCPVVRGCPSGNYRLRSNRRSVFGQHAIYRHWFLIPPQRRLDFLPVDQPTARMRRAFAVIASQGLPLFSPIFLRPFGPDSGIWAGR